VGSIKVELKALEGLRRPVQDITRYNKEIEELSREITRCENQLGESGGSLSGAEIRAKMDSLNEQRTKLQREQKAMSAEKEKARVRIQGLKDQISSMKFRLGEGENKINAKKGFVRDMEEARAQLQRAQEDIQVRAQVSLYFETYFWTCELMVDGNDSKRVFGSRDWQNSRTATDVARTNSSRRRKLQFQNLESPR
jgi:seryl-tRNA synthetase